MAITINELELLISANRIDLKRELDNVKKDLTGLETKTSQTTQKMENSFNQVKRVIAGLGIGALITKSVSDAFKYISNDTMYQVTMGKWKDATRDFTEDLKNKLGISRSEMRNFIGTMYNMFNAMDMGTDNSYKMAKSMSMLAQDMGAFFNVSSEEAIGRLRSGLTGSTEALDQYGIILKDSAMQQYMLKNGMQGTTNSLTEQEKIMIRYSMILDQTSKSQGYLAKTATSPVTAFRMFQDQVKTLSYTFGQLFIPIIQKVLPYLQAFVKLATTGVEKLAEMLGIKIGSALTESMVSTNLMADSLDDKLSSSNDATANMANNLDKASNSGTKVSDSFKDTNKEAKKLAKQLAGFDEMNVLREDGSVGGIGNKPTTPSTPSTSIPEVNVPNLNDILGGSGNWVLPEYDWSSLEGLESEVDKVANRILDLLKPLSNINFRPLEMSFSNLLEAIKPLGSIGQDILTAFFNDILVPLSKYTIERFLPSFFNLLTEAIRMLTPVLKNFLTFGKQLFDTFLVPLAKWSGDAIIGTMDFLAGAFKKVADSQNALKGLTVVLGTLMAIKAYGWVSKLGEAIGLYAGGAATASEITKNYGGAIGGIVNKMSPLIDIYQKYNSKLLESNGVMGSFSRGLSGLGSPISAIGQSFLNLRDNLDVAILKFKGQDAEFIKSESLYSKFKTSISNMGISVKDSISNMATNVKTRLLEASGGATGFEGAFNIMKTGVTTAMSSTGGIVSGILGAIGGGLTSLGAVIAANPLGVLVTVFGLLMSSSDTFRESIQNLMSQALEPIGAVMAVLVDAISPLLSLLGNLIASCLKPLTPLLQLVGDALAVLLTPLQWISNGITAVADGIGKFFGLETNTNSADSLEKTSDATKELKSNTDSMISSMEAEQKQLERSGNGNSLYAKTLKESQSQIKDVTNATALAMEATKDDKEATEETKIAHQNYTTAVNERTDAVKEIEEIEKGYADTQLGLIGNLEKSEEAVKNLKDAEKEHGTTFSEVKGLVDSGKETWTSLSDSQRAVYKAGYEVDSIQQKVKTSQEQVAQQNDVLKNKNETLAKANENVETSFNKMNKGLEKTGNALDDTGGKFTGMVKSASSNSAKFEKTIKDTANNSTKKWQGFNDSVDKGTRTSMTNSIKYVSDAGSKHDKTMNNMESDAKDYAKTSTAKAEEVKKKWNETNTAIDTKSVSTFKNISKAIQESAREWNTAISNMHKNTTNDFSKIGSSATSMKNTVNNALNDMKTNASTRFKSISTSGINALNDIKSPWKSAHTWFGDKAKAITTALTEQFDGLGKKFENIANQIIKPIGNAVNGVIKAMNYVSGKLGKSFSFKEWKIPKFERGSNGLAKDTLGVVNDAKGSTYKELIMQPNGQAYIPKGRNVVLPMKKGTKIMPANQTKEFLKGLPHFKTGIGDFSKVDWAKTTNLSKSKYDIAKNATKSVQVAFNNNVNVDSIDMPWQNLIGNNLANVIAPMAIKLFESKFDPKDYYEGPSGGVGSIDISKLSKGLANFIKKYTNQYVDYLGGMGYGSVQTSGLFGGQCASLASAWIKAVMGSPYSVNGYQYSSYGRSVSKKDAKPGDLAVWGTSYGGGYGHVGIYTGGSGVFQQNPNRANVLNNAGTAQWFRRLPKLAKGGIVDQATIAMIGENGKEAVMPLENNTGWIDTLASKIDKKLNGKANNNNQPIHLVVNVGEEKLIDKVIDYVNDKTLRSDRRVFNF